MNTSLQTFIYNGNNVAFQFGHNDVYVSATEMAKPFDKRPNDYLGLPSTNELIEAITRKYGNCDNQLVTTKPGSIENGGGTWLHRLIALDFAQWLSIDFKLWCTERIDELMKNGITATQSTIDAILDNPDLGIKLLSQLKEERAEKERLLQENRLNVEQLKLSAPKVQYFDEVLQSKSTYTTTQIAKELGMSAEALNKKLCERGIQFKQSGQWLLYSKFQDKGYTTTKTHKWTNAQTGETGTSMLTVWAELGREFIHRLVKSNS